MYIMTLSNTTKIVKNIKCIEFRDFFNADLVNATFCLFITMFSRKILVFRRRILSSVDDPSWFSFFSQFSFYSYTTFISGMVSTGDTSFVILEMVDISLKLLSFFAESISCSSNSVKSVDLCLSSWRFFSDRFVT